MTRRAGGARAGVTARRRWPRILAWCLAGLLVLHVGGGIGAAWYHSSRIDSDALTVHQPGPWVEDLTVDGADPAAGTLTLSPRAGTDASAAMAQLTHPRSTACTGRAASPGPGAPRPATRHGLRAP